MRMHVEHACSRRNKMPGGIEPWTFSDFVLQAVIDKLNHGERSRRTGVKFQLIRNDAGTPTVHRSAPYQGGAEVEWTEQDVKAPNVQLDDAGCPW